jgi:hypothetical protein
MDRQIRDRYSPRGRDYVFMNQAVRHMPIEDLYAVIGYLLEKGGDKAELAARQDAPLGTPAADPPSNEGLIEG